MPNLRVTLWYGHPKAFAVTSGRGVGFSWVCEQFSPLAEAGDSAAGYRLWSAVLATPQARLAQTPGAERKGVASGPGAAQLHIHPADTDPHLGGDLQELQAEAARGGLRQFGARQAHGAHPFQSR